MLLSDIVPSKGKVLVKKDAVEDKTKTGIIHGTNSKGRCVTATVLSGDRAGQRIVFNPGISSTFEVEGEKVSVIFEYDIIAEI